MRWNVKLEGNCISNFHKLESQVAESFLYLHICDLIRQSFIISLTDIILNTNSLQYFDFLIQIYWETLLWNQYSLYQWKKSIE